MTKDAQVQHTDSITSARAVGVEVNNVADIEVWRNVDPNTPYGTILTTEFRPPTMQVLLLRLTMRPTRNSSGP